MHKKIADPYSTLLGLAEGSIEDYDKKVEVRLGDLKGFFSDGEAVSQRLSKGENPVIYQFLEHSHSESSGNLNFGVTIVCPGKIGKEYHLTRGHYHAKEEAGEVYVGLKGIGIMLMQKRDGQIVHLPISRGIVVYVPPFWAHRTVNVGKRKLSFFYVYPSDAGHRYDLIEEKGFTRLVIEERGKPKVVDNPKFCK